MALDMELVVLTLHGALHLVSLAVMKRHVARINQSVACILHNSAVAMHDRECSNHTEPCNSTSS
jgi:hypothetical protein